METLREIEQGLAAARVTSIFIYPIKSCKGISVSQAPVSSTGFLWDRQWSVVNARGRACTQRVDPKLALVEVKLPIEAFSPGWKPSSTSCLATAINAPGMRELKVALKKPSQIVNDVGLWHWSGAALDEGDEASTWFSDYLAKPTRLIRFNEESAYRPTDPAYAKGYKIMFADEYPFLMVSQGSLDELNARLPEPISVNRFRPNILVDGCEPYSEDLWKKIMVNNLTFHGVKLCYRCKVPTVNQESAVTESEPTKTLTNYRSDKVLRPNKKTQGKVYFGQCMVCPESLIPGKERERIVKVGDPIYVLEMISSRSDAPA